MTYPKQRIHKSPLVQTGYLIQLGGDGQCGHKGFLYRHDVREVAIEAYDTHLRQGVCEEVLALMINGGCARVVHGRHIAQEIEQGTIKLLERGR